MEVEVDEAFKMKKMDAKSDAESVITEPQTTTTTTNSTVIHHTAPHTLEVSSSPKKKTESDEFEEDFVNAENYRKQFAALSTVCALLAGFSFAALADVDASPGSSDSIARVFRLTTAFTMFLQLFACMGSIMCYLILTTTAAKDFVQFWWERVIVFTCFLLGLVGFLLAVVMIIWLKHNTADDEIMVISVVIGAIVTLISILAFTFKIIRKGARIVLKED